MSKNKIQFEYKIVDKRVRRMMTDQMNLILVFDRFEKPVYDAEHKMCFCCLESKMYFEQKNILSFSSQTRL